MSSKPKNRLHCPGCGKACKSFGLMSVAFIPGRGKVIYSLCDRCTKVIANGTDEQRTDLVTAVELRLGPAGGEA